MIKNNFAGVVTAVVSVLTASSVDAQGGRGRGADTIEFVAGEAIVGQVVTGAPYSGEATTTVSQTLADGTHIERNSTTRTWRDSDGRVRREQTLQGLGALNAAGEKTVVTIVDPVAGVSYVLDPLNRRAYQSSAERGIRRRVETLGGAPPPPPGAPKPQTAFDPLAPPPPPPPPPGSAPAGRAGGRGNSAPLPNAPQPLGTRQFEGVEGVGTKRVEVIPAGSIGNDRPIEITDERWESPVLKILLYSRHSDPRTGVVEYRLTSISRVEPPRDLFVVPPDYALVHPREER